MWCGAGKLPNTLYTILLLRIHDRFKAWQVVALVELGR